MWYLVQHQHKQQDQSFLDIKADIYTNVELPPKVFCGIHLIVISQEFLMNICSDITFWEITIILPLHFGNYHHISRRANGLIVLFLLWQKLMYIFCSCKSMPLHQCWQSSIMWYHVLLHRCKCRSKCRNTCLSKCRCTYSFRLHLIKPFLKALFLWKAGTKWNMSLKVMNHDFNIFWFWWSV